MGWPAGVTRTPCKIEEPPNTLKYSVNGIIEELSFEKIIILFTFASKVFCLFVCFIAAQPGVHFHKNCKQSQQDV